MKRIFICFLALALVSIVYAAPTDGSSPSIDPAAIARLDQSAKAYAALSSASMDFIAYDQNEVKGKIETENITGRIAFVRPDKAKVEWKDGAEITTILANGSRYIEQTQPDEYQEARKHRNRMNYVENVIRRIPSGLSVFLPLLVADEWQYLNQDLHIEQVALLPDNGVALTAKIVTSPLPPISFRLYFDSNDYLLRRVEAKLSFQGQTRHNLTTLTNVQLNPALPTDIFSPPPTAKRVGSRLSPFSRLRPR